VLLLIDSFPKVHTGRTSRRELLSFEYREASLQAELDSSAIDGDVKPLRRCVEFSANFVSTDENVEQRRLDVFGGSQRVR
jgi:hypothetical protein